jgi:hypothetical protein
MFDLPVLEDADSIQITLGQIARTPSSAKESSPAIPTSPLPPMLGTASCKKQTALPPGALKGDWRAVKTLFEFAESTRPNPPRLPKTDDR